MKRKIKIILVFLILILVSFPLWRAINFLEKVLENFFYSQIGKPYEEIIVVEIPKRPPLETDAKSAISVRVNPDGKERILASKNPDEIFPIASLTKLMTALIVFENPEVYDFSQTAIISQKAASQENVPIYGNLNGGEKRKIEELLDLMLIYSSNDAAWALAEIFPSTIEKDSVQNFVEKMNQKSEELNLKNTYFINPTGLEETSGEFNHSSVRDLVKLAKYIKENYPKIFEISLKKGPYLIENGIFNLILPENVKILGGKTGYTEVAGGCLLLVLQNENGSLFYNVILGAPNVKGRTEEMQKLINSFIK